MSLAAALEARLQGDLERAIEILTETREEPFAVHSLLGELCQELGRWSQARDAFEIAAALQPEAAEVWYRLALCYLEMGNGYSAGKYLLRAQALGHGQARERLREVPVIRPRDLIVALECSRRSLDYRPQTTAFIAEALRSLGPDERFALVGYHRDLDGYKVGIFCPAREVEAALKWLTTVEWKWDADPKVLLARINTIRPEAGRDLRTLLVVSGPADLTEDLLEARWDMPVYVCTATGTIEGDLATLAAQSGGGLIEIA